MVCKNKSYYFTIFATDIHIFNYTNLSLNLGMEYVSKTNSSNELQIIQSTMVQRQVYTS